MDNQTETIPISTYFLMSHQISGFAQGIQKNI